MAAVRGVACGRNDLPLYEPLRPEDMAEGDTDRAFDGQRSCSRCHVITVVSLLGALMVAIAFVTMGHLGTFSSKMLDPIAYLAVTGESRSGHKIISRRTGKCLDSTDVIVMLRDCDKSNDKQLWEQSESHVHLRDGRCLDAGGDNVHIWKCSKSGSVAENQLWKFDEETGQLRHAINKDLCLQASLSADSVSVMPCIVTNEDQLWKFQAHEQVLPKEPNGLDAGAAVPEDDSRNSQRSAAAGNKAKVPAARAKAAIALALSGSALCCLLAVVAGHFVWRQQEENQTRTLKTKLEDPEDPSDPEEAAQAPEQPDEEEAPREAEARAPPPELQAAAQARDGAEVEEVPRQAGPEEAEAAAPEEPQAGEAAPEEALQAAAEEAEQAAPEEAPQVAPEEAEQAAPEEAPQTAAEEAPQAAPEEAPQVAPEEAPQAAPDEAELAAPEEAAPEEGQQIVPEKGQQEVPEDVPANPFEAQQANPEEAAQPVPEEAAQAVPQQAEQAAPEEAEQHPAAQPKTKSSKRPCVIS